MIPIADVDRVIDWTATRYPPHLRDEMRAEVEVNETGITVFECRPPLRPDRDLDWTRLFVIGFDYAVEVGEWSLLWRDSSDRILPHPPARPSTDITELFRRVDADSSGVFWGWH